MGAIALSLDGYRAYHRERAEPWERQALLKARVSAGDERVGARFMDFARETVYRPGLDERIVPAIRAMKREIDRELDRRGDGRRRATSSSAAAASARSSSSCRRCSSSTAATTPWLRERNSLKALFRLTERGYLAPDLGRALSHALVHLRTVEHRLQLLHEFQTHTLPEASRPTLGRLARRLGIARLAGRAAARTFRARHRAVTTRRAPRVRGVLRASGRRRRRPRLRLPSLVALRATGFADPERARQNLRLILEGRPLVPYAGALRAALERLYPSLLDALWKSPDPDEALNQFERFLSAAGPRAGYIELLADNRDAARRPGAALRRRRSAHPAADRAARAAGLARRSGRARPAGGRARRLRAALAPVFVAGDGAGRAARPAAARQAGRGADDRLALPARRDRRSSATRAR